MFRHPTSAVGSYSSGPQLPGVSELSKQTVFTILPGHPVRLSPLLFQAVWEGDGDVLPGLRGRRPARARRRAARERPHAPQAPGQDCNHAPAAAQHAEPRRGHGQPGTYTSIVQGSSKRLWPGCVNAAGKLRQHW